MHCQLVDVVIPKPKLSIRVTETEFVVIPVPVKSLPWISKVTTPLNNLQDETQIRKWLNNWYFLLHLNFTLIMTLQNFLFHFYFTT